MNRRHFLKASLLAGSGLGLTARSWTQVRGSNEDIRVAVIGFRGRGRGHISSLVNRRGVRLVALCDADSEVLNREASALRRDGRPVRTFTDVRRLLESGEIDAVSTATPNHWHALITIWACEAGKDVYVEKPVSHNLWEGRQMVAAARKYNRIVQTGTQLRSDTRIQAAVQWVREGHLGRIVLARGLCYKRRESIGKVTGPQRVPDSVDYDLWTGPAELRPLKRENLHYDWHWVWNTGNGDLGNQGVHQMDIARWFLGANELAPVVFSIGGRLGYQDDGETPNTLLTLHDYPQAPILFEVRGLPAGARSVEMDAYLGTSMGVVIHCEQGFVVVPHFAAPEVIAYSASGEVIRRFEGGRRNHHANFIEAVRSRKSSDLAADIQEGHLSSALCHLSNISLRTGTSMSKGGVVRDWIKGRGAAQEAYARMAAHLEANRLDLEKLNLVIGDPLQIDTAEEAVVDHERANRMLTRRYRDPFTVPRVG